MQTSELIGRLEAGLDRFTRTYWALGTFIWSALYVAAYFADTEPATRNHIFVVALIHWAARDILAALKART